MTCQGPAAWYVQLCSRGKTWKNQLIGQSPPQKDKSTGGDRSHQCSYFWSNHRFVRKTTIHFITRNSIFLIFWVAMCFIFSSGWYPRHGLSEIWQEPSGTSIVCASKSQGFHRNSIPYNGSLKSIDFFFNPQKILRSDPLAKNPTKLCIFESNRNG